MSRYGISRTVSFVCLAAMACGGLAWTNDARAAATPITVPNVVGLAQAAAETAITGAGLEVGLVTQRPSATVAEGDVIAQRPQAGAKVRSGVSVSLAVSAGPPVAVPNVVGLAQAAAETAITTAGFKVGDIVERASQTAPAGQVLVQQPKAGAEVASDSTIYLVVSAGPPVAVPNVVGLAQAAAETAITTAGLTVGTIVQRANQTVPVGQVLVQQPRAGAKVASDTTVYLVVSAGPPVTAPNVVGEAEAAAETAITTAGLTVGAVKDVPSTTVAAGQVISQQPRAGAKVASGSAVNLAVSAGIQPETVPNVVGMSLPAAAAAIKQTYLAVGTVTRQQSATVSAGHVISQNPAAAASANSGTAVNLVVSAGAAR